MILKKSKLFSVVVCMITVLSVLSLIIPRNVLADSNDKSLTLTCVSGDTVLPGMEWKLYKVGVRTSDNQNFVQTDEFSGLQVNMRRVTPDSIQKVAQTFQAYAIVSGIQPLQVGTTDEYGEVQFSGLDAGLYLISGKLLKIGSNYYQPTTNLIELKEDDSELKYDAYPKSEYEVKNAQPRAHIVYKEWLDDEEHLENRPEYVEVVIYKDEEYYDTIRLSEENNWRYRWVDSTGTSSWITMEKNPPAHYEVNIEYNENYRIQNSYVDEPFTTTTVSAESTTTTTTTVTTASVENTGVSRTRTTTGAVSNETVTTTTTATTSINSGAVTETNNTTTSSRSTTTTTKTTTTTTRTTSGGKTTAKNENLNYDNKGNPKLPQTGQLWWPVIPLSIGGVLFVGAGFAMRTRKKSDD